MNKKVTLVVFGLLLVAFFYTNNVKNVSAQAPCGNIIETFGDDENVEPIADCDNPFGILLPNPDLVVTFGSVELVDGGSYQLIGETALIEFPNAEGNALFASMYRHAGEDYYSEGLSGAYTFTATGTYTIVVDEMDLMFSSVFKRLISKFIPTAHAAAGDRTSITFTITEEVVEPEIDPLILQYAPVLYMHEDEDYFPMNVDSFVSDSALWDDRGVLTDTQVQTAEDLTFTEFETLIDGGEDTEDYYLAYSDPNNSKSIDLVAAKQKYDLARSSGEATTTVYVHRMTDDYTDDGGVKHSFIVLQYWYFYAMNNWAELGGRNNHEGDWESVFIFLDADTEDPMYVAYSSHLNDGDPTDGIFQYDSVRRSWNGDDLVFDEDNVVSFVSLGSHANYSSNNNGIHKVDLSFSDATSEIGTILSEGNLNFREIISSISPSWMQYISKWGADTTQAGFDGPQGPAYTAPTFGEETSYENN